MKTALYIEEGKKQIVLTPETEHEKALLNEINASHIKTTTFKGSFYQCQGGWIREGKWEDDQSLMIVLEPKEK